MARRATVIKQEREKGGALLVLDAGNSLVGDRAPAQRSQGQTSVTAMNRMGYDAMALGPKDLALGLAVLQERLAEAEFAVLSANAVISGSQELVASPYALFEMDDYPVGVIGLSGGRGTSEIAVLDPIEAAYEAVAALAPQADIIILLSQAGSTTDQQIAETVEGIDLIISGGQLAFNTAWQAENTGTLIVHADESSAGHAGRRLGIAQLTFDAAGQLIQHEWQRLTIGASIAEDPDIAAWVREQTR